MVNCRLGIENAILKDGTDKRLFDDGIALRSLRATSDERSHETPVRGVCPQVIRRSAPWRRDPLELPGRFRLPWVAWASGSLPVYRGKHGQIPMYIGIHAAQPVDGRLSKH